MSQPLQPVRRQSLSEGIFRQLRDQILNGELAPGSRLTPEAALAEAAGVSRLTVREAIRRLEQAGLIGVSQGIAPKILDFRENSSLDLLPYMLFGADDVIDTGVARSIIEMRNVIAPEAARLAARRHGPGTAARLEAGLERIRAVQSEPVELVRRTLEFDAIILEASGNIAFQMVFKSLRKTVEAAIELIGPVLSSASEELRAREELARAVLEGDSDRAASVFREFLESGSAKVLAALDALDLAAAASSRPAPDVAPRSREEDS